MLGIRERLLRCIERCRKRERWDEKVDPFLIKWNLRTHEAEGQGEQPKQKCDQTHPVEADSDVEISGKYLMHVNPITHQLTCDCNPCTCEIDGEDSAGVIAPVQTVRNFAQSFPDLKLTTFLAQDKLKISFFFQLINEFGILEKFWVRFNRVALEQAALAVRRDALIRDNIKLKLALRNYMGGINPGTQDICNIHEEVMVNMAEIEPPLSPTSTQISPTASSNALAKKAQSSPRKQTRLSKLTQPKYVRPPHPGTNVTEGVHIVRTLAKSAECLGTDGGKGAIIPYRIPQLISY